MLAASALTVLPVRPVAAQSTYVSSERSDLTLWRFAGWTTMPVTVGTRAGMMTISHFERLCGIPCSVDLSDGGALAISIDGGNPVRVAPLPRGSGASLEASYDDRHGIRIGGWVGLALGVALGGVLAATSMLTGPTRCVASGSYCFQDINVEQLIAGTVIVGLATAIGLALGFLGDGAWLRPASRDHGARPGEEGDIVSRPAASRERTAPTTWSDLQVRDLLRASHDSVVACFEGDRDAARVELTLGTAGRVTAGHVLDESATATETACFQRVLASIAVPATVDAPRTVTLRFSRSAAEDTAEPDPVPATGAPAVEPPAAGRDVPAEVRAFLAGRAASVLACVDGVAVALDASWTADGVLTVHLHGERAHSGEDGCVAAAFAGARLLPAPGLAGTVVHPIAP